MKWGQQQWRVGILWQLWDVDVYVDVGFPKGLRVVAKLCSVFHIFIFFMFLPLRTKSFNLTFDHNNPQRFCGRHGNSCFRKFAIGIIDNLPKVLGKSRESQSVELTYWGSMGCNYLKNNNVLVTVFWKSQTNFIVNKQIIKYKTNKRNKP